AILSESSKLNVMKGSCSVRNGANLTVDPSAILTLSGDASLNIEKGAHFRVFDEGTLYWKDSSNLNIEEGATVRGRLSTPPHKLNEDQRSRFTVKDFEYTGEDLKDKVEPDYRGLKLSLS
ncbi:hypothetical protein, partial [Bacillus licheniformis]|uniref:hypothetical protein n=1 Tax=Bacillus licheniformis TaxID=1402 RepID=UPI00163AF445